MAEQLINGLQIESWRYDLASIAELAADTGLTQTKIRRILATWERLGIAEQRGSLWRLTEYLQTHLPHRLALGLAQRFAGMCPDGAPTQKARPINAQERANAIMDEREKEIAEQAGENHP